MSLTPGTKLGSYDVLSPLGAGGMGEVFRARDTRLGRDVAIKAMPEGFAQDIERLGRFEREARLLASLNHPNIAAIHGIEESEGHRYLILEFVDGESLAQRLARGPLPVDDAIEICRDIAAGLEAAHESGVIHRDLKPGNVMITPDGGVKVLDFGLATTGGAGTGGSSSDLTHSPTLTSPATRAGVILGTAAYMSPEQARGKTVDRRTDIWSFGCVLYECLTGKSMFGGETVSDVIARILEREPDWSALPDATPPRVRDLLQRCLRKDPKTRLRDIGDGRLELSDPHGGVQATTAAAAAPAPRARPLPWMIATGVLLVALVASFLMKSPPEPVERQTMRLSAPLPRDLQVSPEVPDITISPDGRTLLCVAVDTLGTRRIYVRPLAGGTFSALAGTEESSIPFWSPDSRYIAFFSGGNLKRMATDGTGMQVLCPAPAQRGGAWSPSNVIVFQPAASGPLMQIAASGGAVTMATTLDSIRGETAHRFPQFLPDGKHYLYVALPGSDAGVETRVGTLGDVTPGPVVALSLNMATFAEPGYLLFNQNESVVAQPFDPLSFKTTGASRVLADLYNVSASYSGSPVVNASRNGILIQREPRGEGMKVVLMDRRGRVTRELPLPAGHFGAPQFSPDGSRIALVYGRPDDAAERVWLVDVARGIMTRFAFDGQWDQDPRWSRDGKRIVWGSDRAAGRELAWKAADGSGAEEILADVPNLFNDPSSVTSEYVVYRSLSGETNEDIWLLPLTGEPTPRPLIQTRFNELDGFVSPDERWVAYRSDESGKHELYVTSFPVPGSKVRVSSNGAAPVTNARPVTISWREDGRELYYIGGDGRTLMSVPVEPGETFRAGTPQRLFRLPRETVDAGMSADGQTLAVVMAVNADARSILNLVINWAQELEGAR
jgi:Tol biopolymer transport system component